MAAMTDYLENKLIDHIFRNTSFTMPSALYVALCSASPTDAATGASMNEIAVTGNYARAALAPSVSNWKSTNGTTSGASSGTGGQTMNAVAIVFNVPSGNWNSGNPITHFAIVDSASGAGNVLFHGALTAQKTVNNGDPAPQFAIDALTLTMA